MEVFSRRYSYFHEKCLFKRVSWNLYCVPFSVLNVVVPCKQSRAPGRETHTRNCSLQRLCSFGNEPVRSSSKLLWAYRPVAKQWLCKQLPLLGNVRNIHARNNRERCFLWSAPRTFLGNGSVNFPWKLTWTQQYKNGVFCGPCRDVITRTDGAMSSVVSSISQRATAWTQKLKHLHCWELLPSND
jgi:hypothetical protein